MGTILFCRRKKECFIIDFNRQLALHRPDLTAKVRSVSSVSSLLVFCYLPCVGQRCSPLYFNIVLTCRPDCSLPAGLRKMSAEPFIAGSCLRPQPLSLPTAESTTESATSSSVQRGPILFDLIAAIQNSNIVRRYFIIGRFYTKLNRSSYKFSCV